MNDSFVTTEHMLICRIGQKLYRAGTKLPRESPFQKPTEDFHPGLPIQNYSSLPHDIAGQSRKPRSIQTWRNSHAQVAWPLESIFSLI